MSIIPIFSMRDVVRKLHKLGFILQGQRGSHATFLHPTTGRWTTVPIHNGDLDRKMTNAIIKQSGVLLKEFLDA